MPLGAIPGYGPSLSTAHGPSTWFSPPAVAASSTPSSLSSSSSEGIRHAGIDGLAAALPLGIGSPSLRGQLASSLVRSMLRSHRRRGSVGDSDAGAAGLATKLFSQPARDDAAGHPERATATVAVSRNPTLVGAAAQVTSSGAGVHPASRYTLDGGVLLPPSRLREWHSSLADRRHDTPPNRPYAPEPRASTRL